MIVSNGYFFDCIRRERNIVQNVLTSIDGSSEPSSQLCLLDKEAFIISLVEAICRKMMMFEQFKVAGIMEERLMTRMTVFALLFQI